MKPSGTLWPPLLLGETLDEMAYDLATDLRAYRDHGYRRGCPVSYQLTGQIAELVTASDLLSLPPSHQENHVERMIIRHLRYLRRLQAARKT